MNLTYVEIKKFRSIEYCKISLNNINAIVGQNNSGKSAIIRALNCFFNYQKEEANFITGKHQYTVSSQPKIEIGFLLKTPVASLAPYCQGDSLVIEMTYRHSYKKRQIRYKQAGKYNVAPDDLLEKIKDVIAFVYIPPNRDPAATKWEESTLLRQLIEEFLRNETKNRDNLTPKFKAASDYLEKGALKKISNSVKDFYSLNHEFDFSISFDKQSNFISFLNGIKLEVVECGQPYSLDDCGTGLQSLTIIAFHRVLAKLRHKNIVLGLEEPETNLHPQAQRELIHSIKASTEDDGVAQILLTTHSPIFIDNIPHTNISLVTKVVDATRGIKSVIKTIPDTFFTDHELEEFKYYQYHYYRNSDFFYAKFVILVESKNDAEVIKALAAKNSINLDLHGVSIINIDGVKNLPYPFYTVKSLGLPYLLILDKDYFIPYLNDKQKDSLDSRGFPKYKNEYQRNTIIESLIPDQRDRDALLPLLRTKHKAALALLEKHNIICMNYNLEADLVCSQAAVIEYCNILNIQPPNQTTLELLTNNNKAIKKIGNILAVLSKLENRNLPSSYKHIRNKLLKITE
jgi:predicted ATP-dependent endonuclease of OLD family